MELKREKKMKINKRKYSDKNSNWHLLDFDWKKKNKTQFRQITIEQDVIRTPEESNDGAKMMLQVLTDFKLETCSYFSFKEKRFF